MSIYIISLFLATMTTGLMAGIFFTWTNAVTPGIGKLEDMEYLRALQSMNRVILNTAFYLVFICPVLALPLATVINYYTEPSLVSKLLLVASIVYLLGSFLITIRGNIPLNNILDRSDLENFSVEDARYLRSNIETKWNQFNLIRTITSSISFILLIITCLLMTN